MSEVLLPPTDWTILQLLFEILLLNLKITMNLFNRDEIQIKWYD